MYRLFALPLVFLLGCPASVTAEGMDDGFGPGWSAVWFHYNSGKFETEGITLSNVAGLCEKQTKAYEALEAFYDKAEDLDADDECSEIEAETRDFYGSWEALYFEGANYASGGPTGEDGMEDGDFELGEDAYFGVISYTNSPFEGVLEDFDPDEEVGEGCGLDDNDAELEADEWSVQDGELVLDTVSDEANLSGSVEGEMVQKGDDEGAFSATFTAAYCEIDVPDIFSY